MRRLILSLCAACLLGACGSLEPRQGAWVQDTLYFGLSRPEGVVSQAEWQGFVDAQVTPRFPEGLTQWEAKGQWREADQPLLHEDSRVLQILHPASAEAEAKIQAIRAEYKRQFEQTSVLRVKSGVAVDF